MNNLLKQAVLNQIGISEKEFKQNLSDYRDASNGISGFIYYSDTHKFTMTNQSHIVELLEELAYDFGEEVGEMVNGFGVFRGEMDYQDKKDLYTFLSGSKNVKQGKVTNVLAWLCVEHLAFLFDN